jgi:hypothetical protein
MQRENTQNRRRGAFLLALGLLGIGCSEGSANVTVIEEPPVTPNLPTVPQLPPPPHPTTYPDTSYSVYGLRHRMRNTIDTDVTVTGYVVQIYQPPVCEEDRQEACPRPAAPHMWIADTQGETDDMKRLMVVGYAENQEQIDEAVRDARAGRQQDIDPESGQIPIPTDFTVGNKVKVQGRFAQMSGSGFNSSLGVLDYRGHETLEAAGGS